MRKLSGWQKAGLVAGIGCFSVVAVLMLAAAVALVWARSTVTNLGDPTPVRIERSIPVGESPQPAAGAGGTPPAPGGGAVQRLEMDLAEGDFRISPGPPGSAVQVEGDYAENLFELTETHDTDSAGNPRTVIRFRSKAPAWARMLAEIVGRGSGGRPTLSVLIPQGVPLELSLRVAMGESRVDLGGLTLADADVDLAMGDHRLDFSEPVAGQMRRIRVNARMGNITVDNLGNARAETIETSGSMGNLTADLGGAWEPGAEADAFFEQSMGQLTLSVPTDVRLEGDYAASQAGAGDATQAEPGAGAPVVRLRLSTSMGESRVRRY